MQTIKCPLCRSRIEVDSSNLERGDILWCNECNEEFVLISLKPLKVKPLKEENGRE